MLDPSRFETILIDKRDNGVALATLNRPERLNAVNGRMHTELANIAREADGDDEVKVLVLTGAGRAFCAGGDFGPDSDVMGGGRRTMKEPLEIVNETLCGDCEQSSISGLDHRRSLTQRPPCPPTDRATPRRRSSASPPA